LIDCQGRIFVLYKKIDEERLTLDEGTGFILGMNGGWRMKRGRRSMRLQGYDYSRAGAYFVTLCSQNRECLFGEIAGGEMVLNEYGKIVRDEWLESAQIRNEIGLDEFVVMPNHFHGIVWIHNGVETTTDRRGDRPVAPTGPRPRSLGALMAGFKSAVTRRINEMRRTPGMKLWQRNYYDRVIRDENELNRIREYVVGNPMLWDMDRENPLHVGA